MKITWVLLEQRNSRALLPSDMEYKIYLSTSKRLVSADREMSLCWPCPIGFYWRIVCFLFKCIELVLNCHLRLCNFLQWDFLLSEKSVPFLYLPAVISLVHWRGMDVLPVDWQIGQYASGLYYCVGADKWWDMMIWPTITLLLSAWCTASCTCWARKTNTPCDSTEIPRTVADPHLCGGCGVPSLHWVSLIAAT